MGKVIDLDKSQQVSGTISGATYLQISDMADKEKRSISQMVSILLDIAVKERTRRRKSSKSEGNS